jgi:hypothetical protein
MVGKKLDSILTKKSKMWWHSPVIQLYGKLYKKTAVQAGPISKVNKGKKAETVAEMVEYLPRMQVGLTFLKCTKRARLNKDLPS